MDPESVNGVKCYSCTSKKMYKISTNSNPTKKFPKSVWWSEVPKPFIICKPWNLTVHLKECILYKLIPFIENKNVLFGPYMATSHSAKILTDFLQSKKIDFVMKQDNAPNSGPPNWTVLGINQKRIFRATKATQRFSWICAGHDQNHQTRGGRQWQSLHDDR